MITKEERERDQAICEAATAGPWAIRPAYRDGEDVEDVISKPNGNCNVADSLTAEDAAFVSRAREALPAYLRETEEMEQRIEQCINQIQKVAAQAHDDPYAKGMLRAVDILKRILRGEP